jgi:solute carrier family 7 (L-type amino acid transporter), member 6
MQIGSGIFATPTQISQNVASPGLGLSVWLVAGLLAWTGAASFIELGLAFPQNGGIQEYLRASYGDFMGFLFVWILVTIVKPCSFAIISKIFAEYFCRAVLGSNAASPIVIKLFALFGLVLITTLNCLGAKVGPNLAKGFFVMKVAAIISILALAIFSVSTGKAKGVVDSELGWFGTDHDAQRSSVWSQTGSYVMALFDALYCYGGWETVSQSVQVTASLT